MEVLKCDLGSAADGDWDVGFDIAALRLQVPGEDAALSTSFLRLSASRTVRSLGKLSISNLAFKFASYRI
jgi:hypothetical protein